MLQVAPIHGRLLVPEDELPGGPNVVLLGYEAWQSHMGGDPDVIGQRIRVETQSYQVVGVMPEGFKFPFHDQFWIPLRPLADASSDFRPLEVVARLADGASRVTAEAEFETVVERTREGAPERYRMARGEVVSLPMALFDIPRSQVLPILVLQVFSLVMLALVCGCVGVLVLARSMARLGELSVRSALGASRTRIVGQLFTESALTGLLATGCGLIIVERLAARWSPVLNTPAWEVPYWLDWGVNPRTAIAAVALGLISAVFTGVIPGLKATTGDPHRGLARAGGGRSGARFGWGSTFLVAAMVSLTVCCMAMGASLIPGLFRDRSEGVGFDASQYLAAEFRAPPTEYLRRIGQGEVDLSVPVQELFRRRLESEPEVRGVGFAQSLPGTGHRAVRIEFEDQEGVPVEVLENTVYPGFFRGLGQAPVSGRAFDSSDLEEERRSVIVNTNFVASILDGRNPIGRRFRYLRSATRRTDGQEPEPLYEIVGVVPRLGMNRFSPERDAGFYRPVPAAEGPWTSVVIHVGPDPSAFAPRVRLLLEEITPFAFIRNITPLSEMPDTEDMELRLQLALMASVIAVAGLLGVAGLFALVAFTVERRRQEIGVRRALGASAASIVFVIVRRAALQLTIGIAVGGAFGYMAVRGLTASPRADQPDWPFISALVLGGVFVMGMLSSVAPALKGLRITPSNALRVDSS
jgi:predicted permease